MDLGSIGSAALYGAIGGGLGAILGGLLAMPFRNSTAGKTISTILTVAGVVIGINVAEPLLSPYIGKYVGDRASTIDREIDDGIREIREDPLFDAIFEREPETAAEFRKAFEDIVKTSSNGAEAKARGYELGFAQVSSRLSYYLPRSQNADIISFFSAVTDIVEYLETTDPMFCFNYLYNPREIAAESVSNIEIKVGSERHARQQQAGAAVVRGAFDDIPEYDVEAAQIRIETGGTLLLDILGQDRIGLVVSGQKPADENDARAACDATAQMYNLFLEGEQPAETLRHLMVLSTQ